MKTHKFAVFLGAGGNRAFFVSGVLQGLRREKVEPDYVIGFSSSSAILFAHIFDCHEQALGIFGKRLEENKKNFYLFGAEHFPHNRIYGDSVREMFRDYGSSAAPVAFTIIAARTSPRFARLKGVASSALLLFKFLLGLNFLSHFRRIFQVQKFDLTHAKGETLDHESLANLVMGSSTLYPFIKLHQRGGDLLLDGGVLDSDFQGYVRDSEKSIVIHTDEGATYVDGNILHIFSSKEIPSVALDYVGSQGIASIYKMGQEEVAKNRDLILRFVEKSYTD